MNIIFNTYQTFEEFNKTGLEGLFIYPASVWPGFIPLTLFTLFLIVLMSTFFSQKRLTGRGDFYSSFAVASFFTTSIALVMSIIDGLIILPTIITCISITIISVILLLISKDK